MITNMSEIISILNKISRINILLIFFGIIWISTVSISVFIHIIDPEGIVEATTNTTDLIDSYSFLGAVLLVVIFAPFLETIIFQIFLLKSIKNITIKLGSNSWTPSFVLSSLVFSAYHGLGSESIYHGFLIILPILPGTFVFSLLAILEYERKNGSPITYVFFLHAFHNLVEITRFFFFD